MVLAGIFATECVEFHQELTFVLSLISISLSYQSTMEVLETARVVAYCCNETVMPAKKRGNFLVVVWEGTCMERDASGRRSSQEEKVFLGEEVVGGKPGSLAVWHAGDWTGPRILQPEKRLSGDSTTSSTHDIVAMSAEGVKVRSMRGLTQAQANQLTMSLTQPITRR
jgi:hypothetical protein